MIFYIFVAAVVYFLLKYAVLDLISPKKPLDLQSLGRWAVVTGATDGIGRAFAENLAALGLNVVLISRNKDELETTAREISDKYSVSVKGFQAEFTLLNEEMYSQLEKEVTNVDVGILINNFDMGYVHPEYFHNLNIHQSHIYQGIINCNVTSAVKMTQFVLPAMVSKSKGLIVNVSSGFSELPSPFLSLYGATKSFVTKFSEDLGHEYEKRGIRVHALQTGTVATKFLGNRTTSWLLPSPEIYVKSALREIASQKERKSTGYFAHTLTHFIFATIHRLFPRYSEIKLFEVGLKKRDQLSLLCEHCNEVRP